MKTNYILLLLILAITKTSAQYTVPQPLGASQFYQWYLNPQGLWTQKAVISNVVPPSVTLGELWGTQTGSPALVNYSFDDAKFVKYNGELFCVTNSSQNVFPLIYKITKNLNNSGCPVYQAQYLATVNPTAGSAPEYLGSVALHVDGSGMLNIAWAATKNGTANFNATNFAQYNLNTQPNGVTTTNGYALMEGDVYGTEQIFVSDPSGVIYLVGNSTAAMNSIALSTLQGAASGTHPTPNSTPLNTFGEGNNVPSGSVELGTTGFYTAANGKTYAFAVAGTSSGVTNGGLEAYSFENGGVWTNMPTVRYVTGAGSDGVLDGFATVQPTLLQSATFMNSGKLYMAVVSKAGDISVFNIPIDANGVPNGAITRVADYDADSFFTTALIGTDAYDWGRTTPVLLVPQEMVANTNADGTTNLYIASSSSQPYVGSFVFNPTTSTIVIESLLGDVPAASALGTETANTTHYDGFCNLPGQLPASRFTQSNSMVENPVQGLVFDPDGVLWIVQSNSITTTVPSCAKVDNSGFCIPPSTVGAATINCIKTVINPAVTAGTASNTVIAMTINVTSLGTITPTVSGSGFMLQDANFTFTPTATGVQTIYVPVKYDGTNPLSVLTFDVGSGVPCTADLSKASKPSVINVWTDDNCTFQQVGPKLK